MMIKQTITDERVLIEKIKIQSEAFQILIYGLLISLLIQKFFLNASFSQYAVELICVIIIMVYVMIRNVMIGNDIYPKEKIIVNSLVSGIIGTVILAILAGLKIMQLIIFFGCYTLAYFIISLVINYINTKRQKQIEKQLNYEENL